MSGSLQPAHAMRRDWNIRIMPEGSSSGKGKARQWLELLLRHLPRRAHQWKQLGLFTIALLIAFCLWYINELSREYTATLSCLVEVEDPPEGVLFNTASSLPVQLTLRDKGYVLQKLRLSFALAPIRISARRAMQRYLHLRDTLDSVWRLPPQQLQTVIQEALPTTSAVVSLHSDTLVCTFSPMLRQKVAVRPNLRISLARQYMATGPCVVEPDSVTISGPAAKVRATTAVFTEELRFENLMADAEGNVDLAAIPLLDFSSTEVSIRLPVEEYTQWECTVPVRVEGLPDSVRALLMPRQVRITCDVPLSRYRDTKPLLFHPKVQVPGCVSPSTLLITLDSVPEWVHNVDFTPKYLQYLIEKK